MVPASSLYMGYPTPHSPSKHPGDDPPLASSHLAACPVRIERALHGRQLHPGHDANGDRSGDGTLDALVLSSIGKGGHVAVEAILSGPMITAVSAHW
jgi:hypothetical protein